MKFTPLIVLLIVAASVSAFPEGAVRKFNYSARPLPTLQNSPLANRVPEFALVDENGEDPTTRSPPELSFGAQFGQVSSGLDKRTQAGEKPAIVPPSKPVPEPEDEESAEDNDARQLPLGLEDDEPPSTTIRQPPPPIGVHFWEVSSKLNEKKPVEVEGGAEDKKKTEEQAPADSEKKVEESEEDEDELEAAVEESDVDADAKARARHGGRQLFASQFSNLRQNVGCGYYQMRNGNVISFQSNNFNFSEYRNNQLCSWRFFGQHCILRVSCPCFDVPPSSDCKQDHLKITDGYAFFSKFCGGIRPQGAYRSTTNNLNVWFKADWQDTATGFFCYVTCTGPGRQEPATPPVTCPTPIYPGPGVSTTINPSSIPPGFTGEVPIAPPFSTAAPAGRK